MRDGRPVVKDAGAGAMAGAGSRLRPLQSASHDGDVCSGTADPRKVGRRIGPIEHYNAARG